MRKSLTVFAVTLALMFATSVLVRAQGQGRGGRGGGGGAEQAQPQAGAAGETPRPPEREEVSITDHTIRIGNQDIPYKATAGTTMLRNDAGEPTGLIYSVAYTRSDVKDLSTRPISFFYNGGPGSATMWLHMGAFGPRRVWTPDAQFTSPAPYKLVDNTETLLDKTDMVFIDAMGTGYSHATGRGVERDFYGIDGDMAAFGQFINTYINRNNRWNSPKFLMGESYGTFRSAAVGNYLQQRYTMHLNGIVLISSVLDLSTITFAPDDDRPYIYYLPSYAAVAWYHKALKNRPANLAAFVEEARQYAQGEYAVALFKGAKLSQSKGNRRQETFLFHRPERGLLGESRPSRHARSIQHRAAAQQRPHLRPHRRSLQRLYPGHPRRGRARRSRRPRRRRRVYCSAESIHA